MCFYIFGSLHYIYYTQLFMQPYNPGPLCVAIWIDKHIIVTLLFTKYYI